MWAPGELHTFQSIRFIRPRMPFSLPSTRAFAAPLGMNMHSLCMIKSFLKALHPKFHAADHHELSMVNIGC